MIIVYKDGYKERLMQLITKEQNVKIVVLNFPKSHMLYLIFIIMTLMKRTQTGLNFG